MTESSTTRTPAASAESRNSRTTGPIECAPWCADGSGHGNAIFAADQWCSSAPGEVALSRRQMPAIEVGESVVARVYASKDPGEPASVCLVDHEDRPMVLSSHEARTLAGLLNHYAWVTEQDQSRDRNAFELGRDYERGQQAS